VLGITEFFQKHVFIGLLIGFGLLYLSSVWPQLKRRHIVLWLRFETIHERLGNLDTRCVAHFSSQGTEVSEEELRNARIFLEHIAPGQAWNPEQDHVICSLPRHHLVRLVAWYGSIRGKGQTPGQLIDLSTSEPLGQDGRLAPQK